MKKIILVIILFIGVLAWYQPARAGFGISPPYVKSDKSLMPGSHYEQKIMLLRSSADEDLEAQVSINAPEIAAWLKIDKGNKFDLPRGELQVPMRVIVDVPKKAEVGNYKGNINIRIAPKGTPASGVSIALGARVDIDLNVSNETIAEFVVRTALIPDFEMLKWPWRWPMFSRFFHRIRLVMKVENIGNIQAAPTKVHIDVYDLTEQKLLEAHDTKRIAKVPPFQTQDITVSFPTKLGIGQYWGKIKIYKDNEIVRSDKMAFTITAPGKLPVGQPKLGLWPYLLLAAYLILISLIIFILIKIKIWRYLFIVLVFLSWPFRFLWTKLVAVIRNLNLKFWRWLHKKSVKYQADETEAKDKNKK